MISKLIQITITIILFISISTAATYHVSKNGNDNNSGLDNWDNAWATLDKVNNSIAGGDTVWFATGLWRGRIAPVSGISASQPTVYACSAYTEGIASIWASDSLTDWIVHDTTGAEDIWKADWSDLSWYNTWGDTIFVMGQIGNGYDTLLINSDTMVAVEGRFHYDRTKDSVYIWLNGGGDPNNQDIEGSSQRPVTFQGQDHVRLWGFKFRYGTTSNIFFRYSGGTADSNYIEHCHLTRVAGPDGGNMAQIATSASGIPSDSGVTTWGIVVRSCTLGGMIYCHDYFNNSHRTNTVFYSTGNTVVESCVVIGATAGGIYFKGGKNIYSTVRYNYINLDPAPIQYASIKFYVDFWSPHIYGNIIIGSGHKYTAIDIGGNPKDVPDGTGDIEIFNNTIVTHKYNALATGLWSSGSDYLNKGNNHFKYNVIYLVPDANNSYSGGIIGLDWGDVTADSIMWIDSVTWHIDSNLYYIETGDSVFQYGGANHQISMSTWIDDLGYDSNSVFADHPDSIGFANPAYGDFSRPGVAPEMFNIIGVDTFTIYGAWQPDDPLPPPIDSIPPAIIEDLNAIPGDNHGEIILTWTAPGDDGDIGTASNYVIKYSTNAIIESNWESATAFPYPPIPSPSGSMDSCTIDSLIEGQLYYIAIKLSDEVGNISGLSNVPDTFASGILVPTQISTEIDSLSNSVTVSCELVESYKSIYYLFTLDSVSVYSNPTFIIDSLANDTAIAVFEGLADDVNYYWRCCAISTDYADSSAWSPSIEFNLYFGLISSLAESDCRYPSEGEIVPSSKPYFIVRNSPDIYELYFQVDDNDNFNSPVESGSVPITSGDETRWQLPATDPIEQGITYYWRASSNNTVWTSPISFSSLLKIHPYPNPFRASEGHANVTFTNLPQDSSIMISTISGDIILREDNVGPGDWIWDVKNDRGNNLASGVYLYAINFPSGSSNGKVLIIR